MWEEEIQDLLLRVAERHFGVVVCADALEKQLELFQLRGTPHQTLAGDRGTGRHEHAHPVARLEAQTFGQGRTGQGVASVKIRFRCTGVELDLGGQVVR